MVIVPHKKETGEGFLKCVKAEPIQAALEKHMMTIS